MQRGRRVSRPSPQCSEGSSKEASRGSVYLARSDTGEKSEGGIYDTSTGAGSCGVKPNHRKKKYDDAKTSPAASERCSRT